MKNLEKAIVKCARAMEDLAGLIECDENIKEFLLERDDEVASIVNDEDYSYAASVLVDYYLGARVLVDYFNKN